MAELSYPAHLLEVLVIDDRSTDRTQAVIRRYADAYPNFKLIVAVRGAEHLRGKADAMAQGIDVAKGDILLFTDADCVVPRAWVEETVKYYIDETIGIVGGFTSIQSRRSFECMQALDWYVLFSVAAATTRLNMPVTAVGNNLSVRRKAYDAVGGYRRIPFSVTEDYALFHAITRGTDYRARFPLDKAAAVQSGACGTLRELYHQKKRWFTGGRSMDAKSMLLFSVAFFMNVMFLLNILLAWSPLVLVPLLLRVAVDMIMTFPTLFAFRRWKLLLCFPLYELYYFTYVTIYPLIVIAGREIVWKDRAL
jgi:cellulose synthase/poly-beta-1,6-N-acetylglucosamine synthase-like glycosyltransferase